MSKPANTGIRTVYTETVESVALIGGKERERDTHPGPSDVLYRYRPLL